MAGDHSSTTNFNKDILIKDLSLRQESNTSIFRRASLFVLSPSVRNDYKWFDLRKVNLEKYNNKNEKGYLLIRLFGDFLLADLDAFIRDMISKDNSVQTKVSGVHWKFNIEPIDQDAFLVVNRSDKSRFKIKKVSIEGIKKTLNQH